MAVTKEEVNVNKMYGQECILKKEEFMEKYHVKENGLTKVYGGNIDSNILSATFDGTNWTYEF